MIEVLGTDVQSALPYISTVAGATVGVVAEFAAQRGVQSHRETIVEEYAAIADAQTETHFGRIRRHVIAPLVAVGALSGALGGIVWQSDSIEQPSAPKLEVVVDHSKATTLGDGSPAKEITKLVGQFTDTGRVEAHALIAGKNHVKGAKISEVAKNEPFGFAPLEEATNRALDDAISSKAKLVGGQLVKNSGVLAITNGNSLGNSLGIIQRAQAENIPVFVVNVEDKGTDPAVAADLKLVAKATDGTYWDANSENIDEVAQKVQEALVADKINQPDETDRWALRGLWGVLTIYGASMYRKRSQMTLGNEVKKG